MPKTEEKGKGKAEGDDRAEGKAKALTGIRKDAIKAESKAKSEKKFAEVIARVSTPRLKTQASGVAFGDQTILDGPHYTPFPKPTGAKTAGARGCKRAEVTLGPPVGWPEAEPGTDAEAVYPDAITDVRKHIDNAKYSWKSGHVINANFGGYGGSNQNMTCLTSSANKAQQTFDNNVLRARSYLHKVYTALRMAKKQSDFFADLGYGIKVEIEMSDDAWGEEYPWNCVSNSMSLRATIVGEPSETDVRAAMEGAKPGDIRDVLNFVGKVQEYVAKANGCHTVDNRPY